MNDEPTVVPVIATTLTTKPDEPRDNVVSLTGRLHREKAIQSYEEFSNDDTNIDRLNQAMDISVQAVMLAFPGIELHDQDRAFMYEAAIAAIMRAHGASHPLHDVIDEVYSQIGDQYEFSGDEDDDS